MAVNEGAWERQRDKQAGRNVVLTAVAQALRVADMLSRSTYKLALTDAPPPGGFVSVCLCCDCSMQDA